MPSNEKVWVEIETNKGTHHVNTYRGAMSRDDLESWKEGQLNKNTLVLEDTYWVAGEFWREDENNNSVMTTSYTILGGVGGKHSYCTGVTVLRAENIVAILMLRDGEERASLLESGKTI